MIEVLIFLGLWIACGIVGYVLSRFLFYMEYKQNCCLHANGVISCKPEKMRWTKTRRRFAIYLGLFMLFGPMGLMTMAGASFSYIVIHIVMHFYYMCKKIDIDKNSWWDKKTRL